MDFNLEAVSSKTEKINFVPCIKWVKQGAAKPNPEKIQLTKEDLRKIILKTESKLKTNTGTEDEEPNDEELIDEEPTSSSSTTNPNNEDEFNLDKYDDDGGINAEMLGIRSLAIISPDEEDASSDSDSEKEDDLIKTDDNLILVGHVEGDANILEVYVYNENEGSLYVHHDLFLSSFPLCFEWLDYEPGQTSKGNYCAVGSMSPLIEIWDLDLVNCLEPAFTLGRTSSRRKGIKRIGHSDAVLDLAWNKNFHHILASGSVDKTVILWDLDEGKPHTTLKAFNEKVQCLKWHQFEPQTLLAGSCDKTAKVFDCRTNTSYKSWDLDGEAERVIWDSNEPFCFLVATSVGSVQCFDCREGMLWTLPAHEQEVTGLVVSPSCKGLLVTTSSDGTMKSWDYSCSIKEPPVLVDSKELNMKAIHCLEFCPDLPFVVASGGDNKSNNFTVLDLRTIDSVNRTFGSRQLTQLVDNETPNDVEMESLSINN